MRLVCCTTKACDASSLAKSIIENRLAACVQIVPSIQSVYRWENNICQEVEALLLIKTTVEKVEKLTQHIKNKHAYDVPEIISLPIQENEGNQDYLQWLRSETISN